MHAILLVLVLALTSCSSKPKIEITQAQPAVGNLQYDSQDIKSVFDKKSNLPRKFKIAIYFARQSPSSNTTWIWNDDDKAHVLESLTASSLNVRLSEAIVIADSLIASEDLHAIRLAAARYKADAVLVLKGAATVKRDFNGWAFTYALVAPAFFVRGSIADTIFNASLELWDVRNEYLYLTESSSAHVTENYVAVFGKDDTSLVDHAKDLAISSTMEKLNTDAKQALD